MPPAVATYNLRPCHPERSIFVSRNSTGYAIKECRPPTVRAEFCLRSIEWSIAARARIHSWLTVFIELASTRTLSAFLAEDSELLWREHGLPFVIGFLDGVGHIALGGGAGYW